MSKEEEIQWAKDHARQMVRAAFEGRDEIVDCVRDCIEGEDLAGQLSPTDLVDAEIAALKTEQDSWPELTDIDLLEAVFHRLARNGIVPRHNFTCCGNCGVAEIGDEIEKEAGRGRPVKGYVFYHQQDTERAVDGEALFFNYGAAAEDATDDDHVAIGEALSSALKEMGLEVDWDGSLRKRVAVKLDWKRRWGTRTEFVQM